MKKLTVLFASALIAVSCAHAPKKSCCGDKKEVQACCKEKKDCKKEGDCKEESCKKT
jgi:hypothetical protein